MIIKLVAMVTVLLCTAYPVLELTRCIVGYMIIEGQGPHPLHVYYAELILIWVFYLAMFAILWAVLGLVNKRRIT